MKKNGDFFAAWLISCLALAGLLGFTQGPRLIEEKALADSYQLGDGDITATNLKDHNTCSYQFTADDKVYHGNGNDCGHSAVGDKVAVFYASSHPDQSDNRHPDQVFKSDLIAMCVAVLIMPAIMALMYAGFRRRGSLS